LPKTTSKDTPRRGPAAQSSPPGRIKIMNALKSLLKDKEFSSITWSDIAMTAGVNEGLIYRYFKDTRNLLYQVLKKLLEDYETRLDLDLNGIEGALNKLRKLIWSTINFYSSDRVFARILLLEVRSFPGYYKSETYRLVQEYAEVIMALIREGIERGEIREDISPWHLRQVILGGIEHLCLPGLIFNREISPDDLTDNFFQILVDQIRK